MATHPSRLAVEGGQNPAYRPAEPDPTCPSLVPSRLTLDNRLVSQSSTPRSEIQNPRARPGIPARTLRLPERLQVAGVAPGADPLSAWKRLFALEGKRATTIDIYALAAWPRGLEPHELPSDERLTLARSVLQLVWPGFSVTENSQRSGDPIRIVEYEPEWPARFERWGEILAVKLDTAALRIEHVGSTSVPGLPAKPIVDIQVSVADLAAEELYVPQIESAGVQLRSRDHFHRYFRPFPGQPRDVHVHVCEVGSQWEHDHLLFRDYLRANRAASRDYARVKRAAAALWHDDGLAYTDAKSEIILDTLEAAEVWSAAGRPG